MRIVLTALVWLAMLTSGSLAQNDTELQLWADYHHHFYLNPTWEFYGDTGFRTVTEDWDWQKLYARPSLRYHAEHVPLEGRGGLGLFYTHNDGLADEGELRPWAGAFVKWPSIGVLTFTSYFRLEGRFMWYSDDRDVDSGLRFRYKLGTKIPFTKVAKLAYFYAPLSFEWFEDVGPAVDEVFAAQFRFDVGAGYVFGREWVGELHLIVQRTRSTPSQPFETDDYILRLTIKRLWSTHDYMSQEA
ncbi:MAG: DUF2490 domain-containing protein [Candidatus Latescibacterota bacterium]|nr:MAG: DUF2490 domain-containing protein [Candidatus Latescibacterota bacterium]